MKTKATEFDPNYQTRGKDARRRMSHTKFHNMVLDAISRGERPAEAAQGVPMTDVWFEILKKQAANRIKT